MTRLVDRLSVAAIAVAASLWATDAYFRSALLGHLSAAEIVLLEDALIAIVLAPLLIRNRAELARLGRWGWVAAIAVGIGPQAVATVLFTASFAYHNFAITYVLQQVQPLIAILLAGLLLGERRQASYWPALLLALAGVYLVVFAPDLTAPVAALPRGRLQAGLLALGAAALWALGTVLGRYLMGRLSFPTTTSLRVTLALPALLVIVLAMEGPAGFTRYRAGDLPVFAGLALVPGLLALLLYYRALRVTPASLSIIAEMAYPVAATLIASAPAPFGFGQSLYPPQILGTALLMGAIVLVNWGKLNGMIQVRRERAAATSPSAP
jgi:drug/metabolite transporter, DME family